MRRLLVAASLLLVAATTDEVVSGLEADGYYIEPGSSATEQVVSDAVFEGRSDGGQLYIVVLAEEPGGGAPTFSDTILDRLGAGYVVTVAPETVGFSADGSAWSMDEMNEAIDASLEGASDDQVVELFIAELTGAAVVPSPGGEGEQPEAGGSGFGWIWLVVIAGGALLIFSAMRNSSRKRAEMAGTELERVKTMAKAKLAEVANDIIEMEDEVELSDNPEVKAHYQSASATYSEALARIEKEPGPAEMVDVVRDLDTAIWELDAAEALLDGKPVPEKPKPPEPPPPPKQAEPSPAQTVPEDSYGRRPQRQSSYAGNDLMTALWALLALSGRGGGWGGMPGGFGGPMGGGGGGRMRGGGMRLGGGLGRIRGGGRRR
jgi:hypothetical protein